MYRSLEIITHHRYTKYVSDVLILYTIQILNGKCKIILDSEFNNGSFGFLKPLGICTYLTTFLGRNICLISEIAIATYFREIIFQNTSSIN